MNKYKNILVVIDRYTGKLLNSNTQHFYWNVNDISKSVMENEDYDIFRVPISKIAGKIEDFISTNSSARINNKNNVEDNPFEYSDIEHWVMINADYISIQQATVLLGIQYKTKKIEVLCVRYLFWKWLELNTILSLAEIGLFTGHSTSDVSYLLRSTVKEPLPTTKEQLYLVSSVCSRIDPNELIPKKYGRNKDKKK